MPKLMNTDVEVAQSIPGFQYSHVSVDKLSATEYTLVVICADASGSVGPFKTDLEKLFATCIDSCQKSPRADNLLVRTTAFNSGDGVRELHGFCPLSSIDKSQYIGALNPMGMTPLFDATMDTIASVLDYAKKLYDKQYFANAIVFVLTDGMENESRRVTDPSLIKDRIAEIRKEETLESFTSILVGINTSDTSVADYLSKFKAKAGFDEYVSVGDATPGKLAKLAAFVSKSVSSTSQALGTGGPSQPIDPSQLTI